MIARMDFPPDPRVALAEGRPIEDLADRLGIKGLKRVGAEMIGPCPVCGGVDRFGINVLDGVFNCRVCNVGGSGIRLVMHTLSCTFPEALDWIEGKREAGLSPQEIERRQKRAQEERERRAAEAEKHRERAIASARAIWHEGRDAEKSPVRDYLSIRGLTRDLIRDLPECIRYHDRLPYMVKVGSEWREIHRGPAMLAAITSRDGEFCGVHRTWIDVEQPKGKARIVHGGEDQKSKKTLGSKKGGAIRLYTPSSASAIMMGEGIETTLTAFALGDRSMSFWAGIDLGNMSGRMVNGKDIKFAGIPDLSDLDAFVPPDWCQRLIYIRDGDSEPKHTRACLLAGLRRAMLFRHGLTGQLVDPGDGCDLNDVLMGGDE